MTGEFCKKVVKTRNLRNPVFWVPGLIVISHISETEQNENIKTRIYFGEIHSFFCFLSF